MKNPSVTTAVSLAVDDLLKLPRNWDGYGADPIHPRCKAMVLDVLDRVVQEDTPPPSVVPTRPGGVQLEWHTNGIDLEIEISPDGKLSLLFGVVGQSGSTEIEDAVSSAIKRLTDNAVRRGWRTFECQECGCKFESPARDRFSQSGEDCPKCGTIVAPRSQREDATLIVDKFGNLIN